jgi:hypothetical protein
MLLKSEERAEINEKSFGDTKGPNLILKSVKKDAAVWPRDFEQFEAALLESRKSEFTTLV